MGGSIALGNKFAFNFVSRALAFVYQQFKSGERHLSNSSCFFFDGDKILSQLNQNAGFCGGNIAVLILCAMCMT